jgi:hypothetical protein
MAKPNWHQTHRSYDGHTLRNSDVTKVKGEILGLRVFSSHQTF